MRTLTVVAVCLGWLFTASAQAQPVRLAAPPDCLVNLGCGAGLRSVYGLDVRSVFVPLTVADAGVGALDDGIAEVAVAFSSNPQVSRPDVLALRDDKRMIHADRVVPVVRQRLLGALRASDARDLRARLNAASAVLSTLALRGLNQSVIDGRLPEAVGGEFVDANGLSAGERQRHAPRIDIGFMSLAENETLAHLYGEALRGAGFRVRVVGVGGLRPEAVRALRRGRIDLYPDYDGSLLRYLVGTSPARLRAGLKRTLARIAAEPMRLSRAEDRNVFVMKGALASQLGITKLSDLGRYWQTAVP
jgi:glycine betaine/choline ABC-type transport system substrate-binding protein